jgi:hypothetical protein
MKKLIFLIMAMAIGKSAFTQQTNTLGIGGWFGIHGFWDEVKGGFFINPSAGIRFKISDKSAIIASIVYEMQNMEFFDEIENYNHPSSSFPRENVGSVGINVGISF